MGKGWTVISASPLTPSTVAVIRTGPPRALAVITPDGVTETAAALLEDQATVRPGTTRPLAVLGVAVSWAVPPRTREPLEGETSTVATRSTSAMPSPPLPQEVSATNAASPASVQRAVMESESLPVVPWLRVETAGRGPGTRCGFLHARPRGSGFPVMGRARSSWMPGGRCPGPRAERPCGGVSARNGGPYGGPARRLLPGSLIRSAAQLMLMLTEMA